MILHMFGNCVPCHDAMAIPTKGLQHNSNGTLQPGICSGCDKKTMGQITGCDILMRALIDKLRRPRVDQVV